MILQQCLTSDKMLQFSILGLVSGSKLDIVSILCGKNNKVSCTFKNNREKIQIKEKRE